LWQRYWYENNPCRKTFRNSRWRKNTVSPRTRSDLPVELLARLLHILVIPVDPGRSRSQTQPDAVQHRAEIALHFPEKSSHTLLLAAKKDPLRPSTNCI
jgi:hypothetical protein